VVASIHRLRPVFGSGSQTVDDRLETSDCYAKLAAHRIGRVVFLEGALPVTSPARYAISGRDLYLSTGPQTRRHAHIGGSVVTFEVDEIYPRAGCGWVVTVTGIAEPCMHPSRWPLVARLGLASFDGGWPSIFRLPLDVVNGRRFTSI
jgi:hypothetical protein